MTLADPERALAVAYAPAALRPALTALFALDERLGTVVGTTDQPMIGLIRLAWWREALERLDAAPPPAEPLLAALARALLPLGVRGAELAAIEDGWAALFEDEPHEAALLRYAARGARMFAIAASLLGAADPRLEAAGEGWALADLGHRHSSPDVRRRARALAAARLDPLAGTAWPGAARPLAALAALARTDSHADAGRRQGSPRRLLRMLALRFTGR